MKKYIVLIMLISILMGISQKNLLSDPEQQKPQKKVIKETIETPQMQPVQNLSILDDSIIHNKKIKIHVPEEATNSSILSIQRLLYSATYTDNTDQRDEIINSLTKDKEINSITIQTISESIQDRTLRPEARVTALYVLITNDLFIKNENIRSNISNGLQDRLIQLEIIYNTPALVKEAIIHQLNTIGKLSKNHKEIPQEEKLLWRGLAEYLDTDKY